MATGVRTGRSASWRDRTACGVLAALCFVQMTALGVDSDVLASIANVADFAVALALLVMCAARVSRSFWGRAMPAAVLFAAALVWAVTPMASPLPPGPSWPAPASGPLELIKLAAGGACLLSGALVGASRRRREGFATWVVWGALLWTALGLWMRQTDAHHVFGLERAPASDRFSGTLLNANAAACLFGMLALVALAVLRRELLSGRSLMTAGAIWRTVPAALATCACMTACALTGSRFALLCTLGLGVALSLAGLRHARRAPLGWILPAFGIAAAALAGSASTLARSAALADDWRSRARLLNHFASLALRAPLHGYGLGSFDTVNAMTQTSANAPLLWELAAAHNALLQAVIEGGWPLAALLCATIAVVSAQGLCGLWSAASLGAVRPGFALAALLAVLCSMVDIGLEVPAVSALTWVFLGLLWGSALNRDKHSVRPERSLFITN